MVNPEIVIVPFVFGLPTLGWIIRMSYRHKERMAELQRGGSGASATEARLERLEQAVDSIAVEIERIGEGQRFVTRLLSARPGTSPESLPASTDQAP